MKTVISKAKELVEEFGDDYAIKYFQDKIDNIGIPKDFEEICKLSGFETAINYIKGNIDNIIN